MSTARIPMGCHCLVSLSNWPGKTRHVRRELQETETMEITTEWKIGHSVTMEQGCTLLGDVKIKPENSISTIYYIVPVMSMYVNKSAADRCLRNSYWWWWISLWYSKYMKISQWLTFLRPTLSVVSWLRLGDYRKKTKFERVWQELRCSRAD